MLSMDGMITLQSPYSIQHTRLPSVHADCEKESPDCLRRCTGYFSVSNCGASCYLLRSPQTIQTNNTRPFIDLFIVRKHQISHKNILTTTWVGTGWILSWMVSVLTSINFFILFDKISRWVKYLKMSLKGLSKSFIFPVKSRQSLSLSTIIT